MTERSTSVSSPRVAVVGAGFAGIGLAVELRRAGFESFTVYEKAPSVGGTWFHNTYPGAEVDTRSVGYSFPFKPYPWSRTHAKQAEVLAYLRETVTDNDLEPHLRLGVGVTRATWDDRTHEYHLELDTGERTTCDVLVAATGFLNIPRYPEWAAGSEFRGPLFHTARWEHEHDLSGRTVAVIGTGSTATQVVPELAEVAGRVLLFQREPGWVLPKGEHEHTPQERRRLAHPWWFRWERLRYYASIEKIQWRGEQFRPGTPANDRGKRMALDFIDRELGDRPDLQLAVTPTYPYWGKRLVLNTTFYAALKHPRVTLVPRAVDRVTTTGVVDADGVEHTVDAVVLATGFQPTNYLGTLEVVGRDGRTLAEHWRGEPRAFLGITVPEFPNFYVMYGPGTNGGEIVSMLMRQARHVVRSVKRMQKRQLTTLEVRRRWAERYDRWLQFKVTETVWVQSNNYYKVDSGKVVTQWPLSPLRYALLVRLLGRASMTGRRAGPAARATDLPTSTDVTADVSRRRGTLHP